MAKASPHQEETVSKKGVPWSEGEHRAFLLGLQKYGKGQWKLISRDLKTRTPTQIASHAQKHFLRISGSTRRKSRFSSIEAEMHMDSGEEPSAKRERLSGPSSDSFSSQATGEAATAAGTHSAGCGGSEALSAPFSQLTSPFPFPMMPYPMMFGAFGAPFMPAFFCPPPSTQPAPHGSDAASPLASSDGPEGSKTSTSGTSLHQQQPSALPAMFPFATMPFVMAQMAAMGAAAAAAAAAASSNARAELPASQVCKPEALHASSSTAEATAALLELAQGPARLPANSTLHVSTHSAFRPAQASSSGGHEIRV